MRPQDHARGEHAIRRLEHSRLAFETRGEARREALENAAQPNGDFYLQLMSREKKQILPQDWGELGDAFGANRDPLTGHEPEGDYRALFNRINNALPAPRGLGGRH